MAHLELSAIQYRASHGRDAHDQLLMEAESRFLQEARGLTWFDEVFSYQFQVIHA